ncbi:v-type proton ATPase 16 kDa proteolipid subunit 2 [Coemansia nantahalensis]|uniref:V-type proton ATPase 16 kDa proteolipid subunit 2 n=1 Tax=Coemansia nantahalensis TaxID=2789366 RepID=A0ACC1K5M0_9FUNG|nr:v-type proton ATPase 16 kDa proteolipid subunit 2 [Coemansia nantahalensis]KAJ2773731.1 v-type proton ATPase 16 kDa proteolipid subunit 2 [Coemansia nantahalensis]
MADLGEGYCPAFAPFFGFMGVAAAIVFSSAGAGYGTAKAGIGIAGAGTFRPTIIMRALIPVVMAGIIAVYGLVASVLISGDMDPRSPYSLFSGSVHLASGLCVGMTGLAAGWCIGIVGDMGVRGFAKEPRLFVGMVLILIFAEVLGLYGLIVSLILNTKASNALCK